MFNKCLIGCVHESSSNLSYPLLYSTLNVYANENWIWQFPFSSDLKGSHVLTLKKKLRLEEMVLK